MKQNTEIKYTTNIYTEWAIWSKCFGKVIAVNGVSSSGKSTLCNKLNTGEFNLINSDVVIISTKVNKFISQFPSIQNILTSHDLKFIVSGISIDKLKYSAQQIKEIEAVLPEIVETVTECPLLNEHYDALYNEAKQYIFSGCNVVLDLVMPSCDHVSLLKHCFCHYPVALLLTYSSLESTLYKCLLRNIEVLQTRDILNYRDPTVIIDQYLDFYNLSSNATNSIDKVNKPAVRNAVKSLETSFRTIMDDILNSFSINPVYSIYERTHDLELALSTVEDLLIVPKIPFDYLINTSIPFDSDICSTAAEILGEIENYGMS